MELPLMFFEASEKKWVMKERQTGREVIVTCHQGLCALQSLWLVAKKDFASLGDLLE
jgi:hypothetical protein